MDNSINDIFNTIRISILDMYINKTRNHHILWKESSEKGKFYTGTDENLVIFGKEKYGEDVYEMKFVDKKTLETRYLIENLNDKKNPIYIKSEELYNTILQCQKQEALDFFEKILKK